MTTFEPGASVVFTHGLRDRPRSTAFLARSAAPTITLGFEVLVQLVMAAITTAPWSISHSVPSSSLTRIGEDGRPCEPEAALTSRRGSSPPLPGSCEAGAGAGDVSSTG